MKFRNLLLAAFLLLGISAFGQITRIGSCAAASTSCTPPAHQVGDLFIAYAAVNASSTAPTLPTGWTSITTQSINGTSTADSASRLACKVATTTSETVSGFTSATSLVAVVYRGQRAGLTAACASTVLGTPVAFASTVNTTSTTETFQSETSGDASSWVAGFGYCSACTAGIGTAPTGMTNITSNGAGPGIGAHDTNATAASYTTHNVTLTTAGRIFTEVIEIKAAQVADPTFGTNGGTFGTSASTTLSDSTSGATICYTTDGTTPAATTPGTCSTGSTYSSALTISTSGTAVKALGTQSGLSNSSVATSSAFTLNPFLPNFASMFVSGGVPSSTPGFVQAASCSNAGGFGNSGASDYICQFPELTLSGNLLVSGLIYDNTTAPTVTVTAISPSGTTVDTLSQIVTNTTANANVQRIYAKTSGTGGAKAIKFHFSSTTGFVEPMAAEFYNVSTVASGTPVCNVVSSTAVTAGSITVASGALLVNTMTLDDTTASGALTPGSGFTFALTDRNDSEALQYRLGDGSAINPTITQGTSHSTGSCAAGWTGTAAGTIPNSTRVLHLAHAQMAAGVGSPYVVQVPVAGNLIVVDQHSGGNTITGITDGAGNTFTCLAANSGTPNVDQICYSLSGNTSNTDALSVAFTGSQDFTLMTYDVAAPGFSFDTSTGGHGNNATLGSSFTTCSSCFTPGAQNELIFASAGWDNCTATNATAPSGSLFNSNTSTANHVDGPQPVDQNNGWLMYRNGSSTSALSVTWTMNCSGTVGSSIGDYSYSIASFKP